MWRFIVVLFVLSSFGSGLELQSEESTLLNRLSAVVPHGKRLKLKVENLHHPALRWRFNGRPVSEKCEVSVAESSSTLFCPDMQWSDAGLYEYEAVAASGRKEIVLAVDVKVAECTEELAKQQREREQQQREKERVEKIREECFCSGITDRCRKVANLYRNQIVTNVTESDMVDLKISSDTVEESWNEDSEQESWTYYSLPRSHVGNLLKSYGGHFDFPTNDDGIDEDGPDVILKGKHFTLVHHNRRELLSSEDMRSRIEMTEDSWRQLNGDVVSKSVFMTVLGNVKAFYVKCHQYRQTGPQLMVLDSADWVDRGLGVVTSVEECECRTGYKGLSCESCSRGYYRRYAVGAQGICVSIREKWESLKASHSLKHKYEQMRNGAY